MASKAQRFEAVMQKLAEADRQYKSTLSEHRELQQSHATEQRQCRELAGKMCAEFDRDLHHTEKLATAALSSRIAEKLETHTAKDVYGALQPYMDQQGYSLKKAAEKVLGVDFNREFIEEDSAGMLETINGFGMVQMLEAKRFGEMNYQRIGSGYEVVSELRTGSQNADDQEKRREVMEKLERAQMNGEDTRDLQHYLDYSDYGKYQGNVYPQVIVNMSHSLAHKSAERCLPALAALENIQLYEPEQGTDWMSMGQLAHKYEDKDYTVWPETDCESEDWHIPGEYPDDPKSPNGIKRQTEWLLSFPRHPEPDFLGLEKVNAKPPPLQRSGLSGLFDRVTGREAARLENEIEWTKWKTQHLEKCTQELDRHINGYLKEEINEMKQVRHEIETGPTLFHRWALQENPDMREALTAIGVTRPANRDKIWETLQEMDTRSPEPVAVQAQAAEQYEMMEL